MNEGVPSNSVRSIGPQGGLTRRCARIGSTPRVLSARRILIGNIAVPSYSPGTGNEVANNTRKFRSPFTATDSVRSNPKHPGTEEHKA